MYIIFWECSCVELVDDVNNYDYSCEYLYIELIN